MSGRFREGDSLPAAAKLESNESRAGLGPFGLSVESLLEFLEDLLCFVLSDFPLVGDSIALPAECWRLDDFGNSGKSLARVFVARESLRLPSAIPRVIRKKKNANKFYYFNYRFS